MKNNMSQLQFNKLSMAFAVIGAVITWVMTFVPPAWHVPLAGLITLLGTITTIVKTYQMPPPTSHNEETVRKHISIPPAAGGIVLSVLFVVAGGAVFMAAAGCAGAKTQERTCAPDSDVQIESAAFIAKVHAACDRSQPLSECDAYPGLLADHINYQYRWISSCKKR